MAMMTSVTEFHARAQLKPEMSVPGDQSSDPARTDDDGMTSTVDEIPRLPHNGVGSKMNKTVLDHASIILAAAETSSVDYKRSSSSNTGFIYAPRHKRDAAQSSRQTADVRADGCQAIYTARPWPKSHCSCSQRNVTRHKRWLNDRRIYTAYSCCY